MRLPEPGQKRERRVDIRHPPLAVASGQYPPRSRFGSAAPLPKMPGRPFFGDHLDEVERLGLFRAEKPSQDGMNEPVVRKLRGTVHTRKAADADRVHRVFARFIEIGSTP